MSNKRSLEQGPVVKHTEHNAVLPEEGQSTGNDIDGDVSGTSIQAGSIGELHLTAPPRKPLWRKDIRYSAVPVAAAAATGALALVMLAPGTPDEPAGQAPAAASAQSDPTSSAVAPTTGSASATTTATTVTAARPAPAGRRPDPTTSTPITTTPAPTTTTSTSTPQPVATGVRFSGTLQFGSFHLDLAQPRDIAGTNVWRMPQNRLHGDAGYELAEWLTDGVPGPAECAADLAKRATSDAENLVIGSRVCGKTPGGRFFRVDVVTIDGTTITGDVTVWEPSGQQPR